jgi:NAD(P)-dependent dehydrogenase (short-subunit alcohol dehydrogenase family)
MKGPVVMVTGASAGVGRATVRLFARLGARLGLMARGRERLEDARREVLAAGGDALVLPADVADAAAVEEAASRLEDRFGPIDIWVNNAMASVFSPVRTTTPEEYRRVLDVTFLGYVHGTQAALRRMVPRNRGTIVLVGSALAYRGIPLQSAYCAAKHAVQGFMESLRCELQHDGSRVHVTMVQLPAHNTPQFGWIRSRLPRRAQPVPPIFQPEVAARAIVWASRHRRREVWVGWPTWKAILGNRIVPWYAERRLARMGYEAQQHDGAEDPRRPDNLFAPVAGRQAAHGIFDHRAHAVSPLTWADLHRGWTLAFALAGLALLCSRHSRAKGRTG